jgi:hypothetical protein
MNVEMFASKHCGPDRARASRRGLVGKIGARKKTSLQNLQRGKAYDLERATKFKTRSVRVSYCSAPRPLDFIFQGGIITNNSKQLQASTNQRQLAPMSANNAKSQPTMGNPSWPSNASL